MLRIHQHYAWPDPTHETDPLKIKKFFLYMILFNIQKSSLCTETTLLTNYDRNPERILRTAYDFDTGYTANYVCIV